MAFFKVESVILLITFSHLLLCTSTADTILNFEKEHLRQKRSTKSETSTRSHVINKRQTSDATCSPPDGYQANLNATLNTHYFRHDDNPSISLTWSGSDGVMIAMTTMNQGFITHPSRLYRSTDRGKTFTDISSRINNEVIRKSNGIQVSPVDSAKFILLGYDSPFTTDVHTSLFITNDAGNTFQKSVCSFMIDSSSFKFHPKNQYRIFTKSMDNALWLSTDFGVSWTLVQRYVLVASWDPLDADLIFYTTDPTHTMSKTGIENELYRYSVTTKQATLLAQHVHSFAIQDDFLFLSIQFSGMNGSRVMHVSKNQGHAWNAAQLPMINKQQFYSILDMSEDMVFVHVDVPGDTGHGNIYTSDVRGIVYSLSLSRHLYPNTAGLTDFYKVLSLEGIYITTQLGQDNTVHSRITFDKGGTWQSVSAPAGSTCPPTEKVCNLQIHNYFSASKGVRLPALPMTSKNTIGLIIAHGNLGDGLSFSPPSVFVSSDGGYEWSQPSELEGPHFYGIGDSGGLLFAVPSKRDTVDTIKFSVDEGQCWHSFKFTNQPFQVTGISVEPGEKAADVSIWGWDSQGDGSWMAVTFDFSTVLGRACTKEDYTTWMAHSSNSVASLAGGCLLGARRTYIRRKKGVVCLNGDQLSTEVVTTPCPCQYTDFLCDYGYKRDPSNQKCVQDTTAATSNMDICINDQEEHIVSGGYRKIPGDLCQGGDEPERNEVILKKSCAKSEETEDNFGVDKNNFEEYTPAPKTSPHVGIIVVLVLAVLALGCMLVFLLYKKRGSILKVRYTPLPNTDTETANGNLVGTTSVVDDDEDAVLVDAHKPNGATISYHDDSDEDLLVT